MPEERNLEKQTVDKKKFTNGVRWLIAGLVCQGAAVMLSLVSR
jgi:hypothetical protein